MIETLKPACTPAASGQVARGHLWFKLKGHRGWQVSLVAPVVEPENSHSYLKWAMVVCTASLCPSDVGTTDTALAARAQKRMRVMMFLFFVLALLVLLVDFGGS